jgi:hypothetical protein
MPGTVRVEGLRELERAFRRVDKEETKLLRKELKAAAIPVKAAAEGKAVTQIRRMHRSPRWAVMRVGYAKNLVYMVPKQKGVRGRGPKRRPNLPDLLLDRAMIPAVNENATETERRVQRVLDTVGRQWERG